MKLQDFPIALASANDELTRTQSRAALLVRAADEMLDDLCRQCGQQRSDLIGTPGQLDHAIKRMREVLL